jgi:hypothetical protein
MADHCRHKGQHVARTQIVAGSKMLHHFLPDLIPPIDRQYIQLPYRAQNGLR